MWKDLLKATLLLLVAILLVLFMPSFPRAAEPGLKAPDLYAIYEEEDKGWVLLNQNPCPQYILDKASDDLKRKMWFFGHEYHKSDNSLTRVCWTQMDDYKREDGTMVGQPVVVVTYPDGRHGWLPLLEFKPYVPKKDGFSI